MRYFKLTDEFTSALGPVIVRENAEGVVELLDIEGEWKEAATNTLERVFATYSDEGCSVTEITQEEAVYV